jgi:DNA-binding NarL/FixJ family response regulator
VLHILIADDHGIVRAGLRMLLDRQEGMNVVAEAEDGVEAVEMAIGQKPDIAILDVAMPRMTGLQAARHIREQAPDVHVLLLSMHDDERYLFEALKAGASGYVLKRAADKDLVDAIRSVARGNSFISPHAEGTLLKKVLDDPDGDPTEKLTPREREVVKLIAEAYTNKEIAAILNLAEKTVESHRANVLAKLGMRDRVELVRYAIRRGLIEP